MNKELLNKLDSIRVSSSSPSGKDKWNMDLAMFYFNLLGNEKGIYGMRNDITGVIEYVGEAIDMTWRMYEHFHQVRGFNGQGSPVGDSFYKHRVDKNITPYNAVEYLKRARQEYTPISLWSQEDDGPEGNAARWVAEHDMIMKHKPTINYNLVLPIVATKRSANRFTNELGRYVD